MEAALRTGYELLTGDRLNRLEYHEVRGLEGIREASVTIAGQMLKVAVANGGKNMRTLMDRIRSGQAHYHFVEMMVSKQESRERRG